MSAISSRVSQLAPSWPTAALVIVTLGGALLMGGLLVPNYGHLVILGMLGIAIGLAVLHSPVIGIYFIALTLLVQNLYIVGSRGALGATGVKLLGIAVFGLWLVRKLLKRESFRLTLSARVLIPGFCFVVLAGLSVIWSQRPYKIDVQAGLLTYIQLLAFSALILDVVRTRQHLEWLIRFTVIGALIAAFVTISQFDGTHRAGENVGGDINDTAALLTVLIPYGFYMLRASPSTFWRSVGVLYLIVGTVAVLLTFSRLAYVVLTVTLGIVWLDTFRVSGRRDRLRLLLAAVVAGAVLSGSGIVPWEKVFERSSTISPELEEQSLRGRIELWGAALQMYHDHPILGVGLNGFGYHLYVAETAKEGPVFIRKREKSAHTTLFGIMAELGTAGLLIWLWLNWEAFRNLSLAKGLDRDAHHPDRILIQTTRYILIAYFLFSIAFVTDSHKLFWLILGITEVIRHFTQLELAGQRAEA